MLRGIIILDFLKNNLILMTNLTQRKNPFKSTMTNLEVVWAAAGATSCLARTSSGSRLLPL